MHTVSNHPVVMSGTVSFLGKIKVKGQGISLSINNCSSGYEMVAYFVMSCGSARCTISGLSAGLCFASNIFWTALELVASAKRP